MPPGRIADLIRNPMLSEVMFNQSRTWSKEELREIVMTVRRWGEKDKENQ